jgi:hypothetical protein
MSTDRVSPSPATRVDSAPWRSLAHTGPGRRAVGEGARIYLGDRIDHNLLPDVENTPSAPTYA